MKKFEIGDHIYTSIRGISVLQHHAIVLKTEDDIVTIADFSHEENTSEGSFSLMKGIGSIRRNLSSAPPTNDSNGNQNEDEIRQTENIMQITTIAKDETKKWKRVIYGATLPQRVKSIFPGTATSAKSDHCHLVVSRAHFIIVNGHLVPPYHVFKSNCECMAVWCKVGIWATVQASAALHIAGATGATASIGLGSLAAAQTVTVPSVGVWGWLGGTTQISLLAAQPWLIPVIIAGGTVSMSIPFWKLMKYKNDWMHIGNSLDTEFWEHFWSTLDEELFQLVCSFLYPNENLTDQKIDGVKLIATSNALLH